MTGARPTLSLAQGAKATRILGVGSTQPDRIVTNDELSQRMDTSDQWIRDRVGIIERRFADKDEQLVDLAVTAGAKALADAGVAPSEVDTVIVPNCTMPAPIPNAAAQVADRIGIKAAGAFDLNAACAGFCYGLGVASDLVRAGSANKVLVIGAEKLTDVVDPTDRSTAIIFADGAGAALVGPSEEPGIGPVTWGSAGDLVDLIYMREHRYIFQEGQSVFRWATTQIAPIAMRAVELAGLKLSDIDVLIPHQANLRIVEAIAKRLRAKGARDDMVVADDIRYSGNTSSASIPLALDHMRAAGTVKRGDVVLAVGFGAGLSYAGQVFLCP
ncbi:beta-ketoacyl-ACP synthase III [Saccharomonospora viridis]|jgi:3-oxoacyl-[acyl-carrier-protein] synthase-3|uniref:Beta-ketoacyl-[acyl-carrier-protein] synthase III n=2 Tax=Saccharomonospora viridis TaxID=1852 RepID=C7MYW4_SACVD|nr:beta-ketoacyl-ACP synthase III [Saccharomonospora viridis]ACU96085.1 3-oxoacyl-(acyl-carrier-protein) synthase III [Saccharomonospora viridis DSM 43017]KHF45416.1 3-oxoacyl-ACP synthase [Saccharomonospora viridis]SFP77279.1 3-oxoacyl-[acyl-carrier-protein] synthase-3 [Saccharomonospora viridis]